MPGRDRFKGINTDTSGINFVKLLLWFSVSLLTKECFIYLSNDSKWHYLPNTRKQPKSTKYVWNGLSVCLSLCLRSWMCKPSLGIPSWLSRAQYKACPTLVVDFKFECGSHRSKHVSDLCSNNKICVKLKLKIPFCYWVDVTCDFTPEKVKNTYNRRTLWKQMEQKRCVGIVACGDNMQYLPIRSEMLRRSVIFYQIQNAFFK